MKITDNDLAAALVADALGFDWRDLTGAVHYAGRILATGFGGEAGAKLADVSESAESKGGLLPDWARSSTTPGQDASPRPPAATFQARGPKPATPAAPSSSGSWSYAKPDFVTVVLRGDKKGKLLTPDSVSGTGGTPIAGNGYAKGDKPPPASGAKFSFGFDQPSSVALDFAGQRAVLDNVAVILICTTNTNPRVAGDEGRSKMRTSHKYGYLDEAPTETGLLSIVGELLGLTRPKPTQRGGKTVGFKIAVSPLTGRQHPIVNVSVTGKGAGRVFRLAHFESVQNAKIVGQRAVALAKRILTQVSRAPGRHAVHGLTGKHLTRPRISTSHRRLTLAELSQYARQLQDHGTKLIAKAVAHDTSTKSMTAKMQNGVTTARAKYGPHGTKGQTVRGDITGYGRRIHGTAVSDLLGVHAILVGDDPAPIPDPLHPGFLTDNTPDPNYDPNNPNYYNTGGSTGTSGTSTSDGSTPSSGFPGPDTNYGMPPAPGPESGRLADGEYMADPRTNHDGIDTDAYALTPTDPKDPLSGLPSGAILYDPSVRTLPVDGIGSFNRFVPGYVSNFPDGGQDSGFEWGNVSNGVAVAYDDGWYWYWASSGGPGQLRWKHDDQYGSNPERQKVSLDHQWGPLIGNPYAGVAGTPWSFVPSWVKGMRYDSAGDRWFWFYDSAPPEFRNPGDMQRYNQALLDWQTAQIAAKQNWLAEQAQIALDQKTAADVARQTAASDTQTLHAADVAAVQQAQQQGQQAVDQGQLDLDTQRQQLDLERQYAEADLAAQQGGGGSAADGSFIDDGSGGYAPPDDGGGDPLADLSDATDRSAVDDGRSDTSAQDLIDEEPTGIADAESQ